jgi:hypothetical protein
VIGFDTVEAVVDAGFEVVESFVINIVKTVLLHKLPKPFNQIQVRGIARKKLQRDAQLDREIFNKLAVLIACVVQHDDDRSTCVSHGKFVKHFANGCRINVTIVGDCRQLTCDHIVGTEYVPTFSTGRTANENSRETPQATKKRRLHKMHTVHEKQNRLTGLCTRYFRLQDFF